MSRGKSQQRSKTIYFDYEKDWKQRVSTNNDLNLDDPKFTQMIENEILLPEEPIPNESALEAEQYLK